MSARKETAPIPMRSAASEPRSQVNESARVACIAPSPSYRSSPRPDPRRGSCSLVAPAVELVQRAFGTAVNRFIARLGGFARRRRRTGRHAGEQSVAKFRRIQVLRVRTTSDVGPSCRCFAQVDHLVGAGSSVGGDSQATTPRSFIRPARRWAARERPAPGARPWFPCSAPRLLRSKLAPARLVAAERAALRRMWTWQRVFPPWAFPPWPPWAAAAAAPPSRWAVHLWSPGPTQAAACPAAPRPGFLPGPGRRDQ